MVDGLKLRKRESKLKAEDEVEFLDEEEQERLLEELRQLNENANINIQRGLVLIGLIVSSLFLSIFLQQQDRIIIPISYIHRVEYSILAMPKLAAFLSIFSICSSILSFIGVSKVKTLGSKVRTQQVKKRIPVRFTVIAALLAGCIAPLMIILQPKSFSLVEFIYWLIPLLLSLMYYSAFKMMSSVDSGLEELELSKYKYKGA